MFRYDVVTLIGDTPAHLLTYDASWSASIPIFYQIALTYFLDPRVADHELDLLATLEGEGDEPDRQAHVCSARPRGAAESELEIRAGPLLEAVLKVRPH